MSKSIADMSEEYEKLTGRQGLLYKYNPGDGTRYVFRDVTKLSESSARRYMESLLEEAKQEKGKS